MKKRMLLPALLMASCATVDDLRDRPAFIDTTSRNSLQDIRSCLSRAWESRSGMTNYVERDRGFTLSLKYTVYSSTMAAAVVDVDDIGDARRVVVHARKGDANDKLRGEVQDCI